MKVKLFFFLTYILMGVYVIMLDRKVGLEKIRTK